MLDALVSLFHGRWAMRLGVALAAIVVLPLGAHAAIVSLTEVEVPAVVLPGGSVERAGAGTKLGRSQRFRHGNIDVVRLEGTPEELGYAHARLLYEPMVETERTVWQLFEKQVPLSAARWLILDFSRWRYRDLIQSFDDARQRELAAKAAAFQPDAFSGQFPTYQRFGFLTALYDIALSFEGSPLVGCTSFVFSNPVYAEAGGLLARAFDFDVDPVFDQRKVVFLILEEGRIPFASVAWPGLVGVVSGMNAEGLAVVVHGARAGEPRSVGEPVVHALRRVLQTARDTEEALAQLTLRQPMVSHLLIMTDAQGRNVAVERIPGRQPYVRDLSAAASIANHFEGPADTDPKNQRVRQVTSTLARAERGAELVAETSQIDATGAVALLRDRGGAQGRSLELGDRDAIDALIATHGVVMETGSRSLWVSESPHLLGRFVKFDLKRMLAERFDSKRQPAPQVIGADPLLESRDFERFQRPE